MSSPSASHFENALSPEARQVVLFSNPVAGAFDRRDLLDRCIEELHRRDLNTHRITSFDELSSLCAELSAKGELRAVIAAGGDGTVAESVNRTPPNTPIAVLPLGTENLLARYLKQDREPVALAERIAVGQSTWFDACRANGRLCLLMATAGFDAEVVRRLHEARKGHIRRWTYAKPILHAIRRYHYVGLRVYCESADGLWDQPIECRWAFAFNLPCYGGGLKFVTDADGTDGLLDVCTFRRGGLLRGLGYLAAIVAGFHPHLKDCTIRRTRRVRIESDQATPYQIDGDPGGELPLEIEMVPRRLRVLVSPTNRGKVCT